ncbi:DUF6069 family protein [Pseudonocardia humida]|uniref:Secreted protein with PEP-CTERM sorting signal n=1 Tax=Pseudonocardia humida TaxID=2800819 RepID=A0ABT1A5D1_9PSEU|nr:DUF6069 family protein [Pseudonocardia humida]MCO1658209.1 hypothetical protein [Pseudonocardia humida]
MTTSISPRQDSPTATRVGLGLLAATAVAVLGNALIALVVLALGPGGVERGLQFAHYAPLTLGGVLLGTAGWALVRRLSRRPRAVLRVLVPVVVVLSFGVDLALLAAGTGVVNVVGLMLMHVVVAAAVVPALARVLPLPR